MHGFVKILMVVDIFLCQRLPTATLVSSTKLAINQFPQNMNTKYMK